MMKMNAWDWIAIILLIIGALNWGMIGLFNVDVIARIFGVMSGASRVIYVIIGLGGLYMIGSALAKYSAMGGATLRRA